MPTATRLDPLVTYLHRLKYEELPSAVVERAVDVVIDTAGCILGGSRTEAGAVQARVLVRLAGAGRATAFGVGRAMDPVTATMLNATCADILDYEDTTVPVVAHPSAAIVPAALAIGEELGASGRDVVAAVVAGYEVGLRIGRAVLPSPGRAREVPVSGAWTAFGAAAAAAKLLRLTPDATLDAFGYAGSSTPLPTWYTRYGRPCHWLKGNLASQARAGVLGALLAREGCRGPRGLFDADLGFWRMVGSDRYDPAQLTAGLGARYETLSIHFKAYPICHYLHPTVELVRRLTTTEQIAPEDVEVIVVRAFRSITNWFDDPAPANYVDAQFSIPFAAAVACLDVPIGPTWYRTETLRDPRLLELAHRVRVEGSDEAEAEFERGRYPTAVTIRTHDGRTVTAAEQVPLGAPERPLSRGDLEGKFVSLAEPLLGAAAAARAWRTGQGLPSLADVRQWTAALAPDDGWSPAKPGSGS